MCKEYVLRLEISMYDALRMHRSHRLRQLPEEDAERALAEVPVGLQVVRQVTPVTVLYATNVFIFKDFKHKTWS